MDSVSDEKKIIEGDGFFASIPYDSKISHMPNESKSEKAMRISTEYQERKSLRLMGKELRKKGIGYNSKIKNPNFEKTI